MRKVRALEFSGEKQSRYGKYSYFLYRDLRARKMTMRWQNERGLIVVLPKRFSKQSAMQFIEHNTDWIELRQKQWVDILNHPQTPDFQPGGKAMYKGRLIPIVAKTTKSPIASVVFDENLITVLNPELLLHPVDKIIIAYLSKRAKSELKMPVIRYAEIFSIDVNKISVRDQRTRWASWSSRNNISLNWRLIMLPERILQYVIIHELMHHFHPNHSRDFWQSVANHCPDWQTRRNELKSYVHFISLFR